MVPILRKDDFELIATDFLSKYFSQAIYSPAVVPIEKIATQDMMLQIRRIHISEDLSILGQIFFNEGLTEIYLKDTDEIVYEKVERGTVFIDPDVIVTRNLGSERNTIAHECVHWYIHQAYHTMQILAGGDEAVAFKCPYKAPSDEFEMRWSNEDWMEWQANGIAPKILMPHEAFRIFVQQHPLYTKIKNGDAVPTCLDLLITDAKEFFQVSKQSASIRLSELGLI